MLGKSEAISLRVHRLPQIKNTVYEIFGTRCFKFVADGDCFWGCLFADKRFLQLPSYLNHTFFPSTI
jgi:hypothetical protein